MSKPLTTLGEQIAAKGGDWRAQLRAADVPRRPPPSSASADRGYVEQPGESAPPPTPPPATPRRRVETPTLTAPVALIRTHYTREGERKPRSALDELLEEHVNEELAKAPAPPPDPAPLQLEAPPVAAKKKRKFTDKATQIAAVRRVLAGENAAAIARELGVHPSNIANWKRVHAAAIKRSPKPREPEPAQSSSPAGNGALPPPPTLQLDGLEAYIQAVVDRAVAVRVRSELRRLLGGEGS